MKVVATIKYDIDPTSALKLEDYPKPKPGHEEVLVKVCAASVNPIDTRMRSGYGRTLFTFKATLPIVLGRDFSGEIEEIGSGVKGYEIGDPVFGVVSPFRSAGLKYGSHSEFICVPVKDIIKKPENIDHLQAASLPYVALTTYNALIIQAEMKPSDYLGKKVFLHAGAGGIGSYAIQFLKALGAQVTTTCSTKNVEFLKSIGATEVIDYTKSDYSSRVAEFDIAYDLLGKTYTHPTLSILKSNPLPSNLIESVDLLLESSSAALSEADQSWDVPQYKRIIKQFDVELVKLLPHDAPRYISIVGPMMPLTDEKGLHNGMQEFVSTTIKIKADQAKAHGRIFHYSVFEPSEEGLKLLVQQVSSGQIKPIIGSTFPIDRAPEAHSLVETGHIRGKVVLVIAPSYAGLPTGN